MDYLADTVAIVRHLLKHPALGEDAAVILRELTVDCMGSTSRPSR